MQMREMMEEYMQHAEQLQKQVFVQDRVITFNVNCEYNVPLNRCKSTAEILAWVVHLSEKTWITTEHLERFILLACRENGFELPNP